ncbi:ribosomal protein S18-alanine N-acetyltransferase [Myxococcota bacterium]|nr:ribosomal protein S18-alanine N-acetyltransferase [Myxococcota bacterium]
MSAEDGPPFRLRPATLLDVPQLAALEASAMTGAWTEREIAEEAQSSLARLVLAEDLSGAVLGYALGWEVAGETQILRVAVGASHRRQGLGRALLEALCLACGGGEALLEVRVSNLPAITLYERAGFVITGRREAYYRDGEAAILMSRPAPTA